jgi:hypothetical protein
MYSILNNGSPKSTVYLYLGKSQLDTIFNTCFNKNIGKPKGGKYIPHKLTERIYDTKEFCLSVRCLWHGRFNM